jgi:hypothetical protein
MPDGKDFSGRSLRATRTSRTRAIPQFVGGKSPVTPASESGEPGVGGSKTMAPRGPRLDAPGPSVVLFAEEPVTREAKGRNIRAPGPVASGEAPDLNVEEHDHHHTDTGGTLWRADGAG